MATLASMIVRLGIDTDALREGADKAKGILGGLGKAVAGLGVGVPAAAAVAAGVGGMAAAFASAGVAAKAFQLAVGPQMASVAEVAGLAEEAEKAAAEGAEDAAEKQKAYTDALAKLPAATQTTAKEFIGLKKDFSAWSDSLSGTTMPIFTKGLQIVRRLLPLLTPFVKAAAGAFKEFLDEIDKNTKGKGLEKFADSMAKIAGKNLKSLLFGLKNIAVGIGGIIKAFLPLSSTMSGGFEESTAAFAKWGQGLSDSEGFAQFVALAKQGAQTLGTLAQAALKLLVALGPLIGIAAVVSLQLAKVINSLPPAAVEALAVAVVSAVVAFKAFRAASSAVETASALMSSRLGLLARRWVTTAARSIASGARIAASATVSAARTAGAWAMAAARTTATWLATIIRVAAVTVARFTMMAARAMMFAARMAASWIIAMGPVGWIIAAVIALVALIIANWDKVKAWTVKAWNAVWGFIKSVAGKIWDFFLNWTIIGLVIKHWSTIKAKTVQIWNAVVGWIKGVPGMIYRAFLNFTPIGLMIKHWSTIKRVAIERALQLVKWVRGLPGRIGRAIGNLGSLLYNKGMDLIRGLWNGIKSMGGWLADQLKGFVTAFIPGPIADALGINSPSKLMADKIGRWLPPGIVEGAEAEAPAMDKALHGLVDVPGLTSTRRNRPAPATQATTVRVELAGPEALQQIIRAIVTRHGGSVQKAFGTARA